jgi:hypothetical protein
MKNDKKDPKKDAVQVNLKKPVPVLILYSSAVVREDGEVDFYDDVYKQDADLQKALGRGYPYPDCCDPALKNKKPPVVRTAASAPPQESPAPAASEASPSPQPVSPP